jgi:aminopeptidase YwaD
MGMFMSHKFFSALSGFRLAALVFFLIRFGAANAQSSVPNNTWTVRPEWVRAHEEFLASDALAGRGSATRDEEIAANYVASEFISYGLKPAPGMTGFIQSAEVVAPKLDGHAVLQAGGTSMSESTDFDLLMSSGAGVSGALVNVPYDQLQGTSFAKGSVVFLHGASDLEAAGRAISRLTRAGAAAVLLDGTGSLANAFTLFGGHTRTPIRLANSPSERRGPTAVLLRGAALSRIQAMKDGETVSLTVHALDTAKPHTFNAIGYLRGSDPGSGTILLTAHLDHLGFGRAVEGDSIYNGANDDAAGTTAVLELAHALASGPQLRRNVLFVCYGSEEVGELGSTYFGEHPPVPLANIVANLEFEMIGNQDPKMPKGTLLLTGWERSNLGPTLKQHGALVGPDPYPEQHYFERSDNYALALKGVVAHTAAGWGNPPTYHQPSDDLQHLDLSFMTTAIQSLVEPVRWLASSDFKPQWNASGRPSR